MNNTDYMITNKELNFQAGTCHRIKGNMNILSMDKKALYALTSSFSLIADQEMISKNSLSEVLTTSKERVKKDSLTKKLTNPENKNNGGYILTGFLTVSSILILGVIIFNVIKYILG